MHTGFWCANRNVLRPVGNTAVSDGTDFAIAWQSRIG